MDGGIQTLKMPAPSAAVSQIPPTIAPNNSHIEQSHARAVQPHSRLPNLEGGKTTGMVSPAITTFRGPDSVTSPYPGYPDDRDYQDLRVGLPRIHDTGFRPWRDEDKRRKMPTRVRGIHATNRSLAPDDQPRTFNPEPLPFHQQIFNEPLRTVRVIGMPVSTPHNANSTVDPKYYHKLDAIGSSTTLKKVPFAQRHGDMWASSSLDQPISKTKGYIVHTGRYQWDDIYESYDDLTQRGRLQMEIDYVDRLRTVRRRRECIPHREPMDFMMGGQRAELNERDDIMQEIKNLKGVILPTAAKDLYVGRGFTLPQGHALNKASRKPLDLSKGGSTTAASGAPKKSTNKGVVDNTVKNGVSKDPSKTGEGDEEGQWSNDTTKVEETSQQNKDDAPQTTVPSDDHDQNTGEDNNIQKTLLKGSNSDGILEPEEVNVLRNIYKNFTVDSEGNTKNTEDLRKQIPGDISPGQEIFLSQVFDMVAGGGHIVEEDFISFHCLCKKVTLLQDDLLKAYDTVDKDNIHSVILRFGDLFQSVDRQSTGRISLESLEGILPMAIQTDSPAVGVTEIQPVIDPDNRGFITKTEFLAYIPYFLTMAQK